MVAQTVKHVPAMWKTWVQSLGWEDPLEKKMAPHSSTLVWRIPWMEEHGRLQSTGSLRVRHDWATSLHLLCCSLLSICSIHSLLFLPLYGPFKNFNFLLIEYFLCFHFISCCGELVIFLYFLMIASWFAAYILINSLSQSIYCHIMSHINKNLESLTTYK